MKNRIDNANKTNGVIFTIGQGKKDLDSFLKAIKNYKIDLIVDLRSRPYSKIVYFQSRELKNILKKEHIKYFYLGDKLGGEIIKPVFTKYSGNLDDILVNNTFREGLKILWNLRKNYKIGLFCAEEDPLECHRFLCVGAVLKLKGGIEVFNILHPEKIELFDQSVKRLIKELKMDKIFKEITIKEISKAFWYKLHYIYSISRRRKSDIIHYRLF